MPRDTVEELELTSYRVEQPVTDEVLRVLIALRELHSDPNAWSNTGIGDCKTNWCIIAGAGATAVTLGVTRGVERDAELALIDALPEDARGSIVRFNERMGTTHADLMAFYDRAIAARRSEIGA